jgi:hypothetical protein
MPQSELPFQLKMLSLKTNLQPTSQPTPRHAIPNPSHRYKNCVINLFQRGVRNLLR